MRRLLLSVTIMLFIGFLSACNQDGDTSTGKEDLVTAVETVQAIKEDLVVEKKLYGRTAAASVTPIIVQTPGEIEVLEVASGDKVEEDDLIATLNTPVGKQNIKAPKTGEVIQLKASVGDIVSDAEPLAMIAQMDEMTINASVTANVRSLLKKDDKLNAIINDQMFEAKISSVSKMPDETGLYPIEASVKNKDDYILPGMIAVLHIPEERIKESIILPTAAIVEDSDGAFVYIVKDNHVEKVAIEIKVTQSDRTAIKGEVNAGDQIVINGQLTLTDGSKVNVVKEGE